MPMNRRILLAASSAWAADAALGQNPHHHHPDLPVLAPATEP
jgi:hypothetical protein